MHQAARKKLKSLKKKKLSCQNCCLTLNCYVVLFFPSFHEARLLDMLDCHVRPKLLFFTKKMGPNGCAK